jgi:hypothetical protein
MIKLATNMAITAAVALTMLTATAPADAASRSNQTESYQPRHSDPGYYEGLYEYHADVNDRASSPYSGF